MDLTHTAVVAERPGRLDEVLVWREVVQPSPGPGEVRVRMLASTINPSDAVTVSGAYGSRTTFPFVPGFEGVGVVEEVGDGVDAALLGQRVLPIGSAGCWARSKVLDARWCLPVPDGLDDEGACFAYVNPLTAHLMVERTLERPVEHVAVTAATSAIAGHLAELLAARGVHPVAIVRGTPGHHVADADLWRAVVDTSTPTWRQELQVLCPGGLDVALDAVGGALGGQVHALCRPDGRFIHYGLLSGTPLPQACFTGGAAVEMFRLRDVVHRTGLDELPDLWRPVRDAMLAGGLRTRVDHRVPLSSLVNALRDGRCASGKTLIDCAG